MKLSRIILKKYYLFFLLLFPGQSLMAQEENNTGFRNGIYFNPLGLLGDPHTIHISYERELKNKNFLMISPRLMTSQSGTGVEVQYRVKLSKRSIDRDLIYHIPTSIIYFAPYASYDRYLCSISLSYHPYISPFVSKYNISSYSFGIVFGMKSPIYQFPNYHSIVTLDTYIGIGFRNSNHDCYHSGIRFYGPGYSGIILPKLGIQLGITF